jgi:hypothetical protein
MRRAPTRPLPLAASVARPRRRHGLGGRVNGRGAAPTLTGNHAIRLPRPMRHLDDDAAVSGGLSAASPLGGRIPQPGAHHHSHRQHRENQNGPDGRRVQDIAGRLRGEHRTAIIDDALDAAKSRRMTAGQPAVGEDPSA